MAGRRQPDFGRVYDSLLSFYRDAYSDTLQQVVTAGRVGTTLVEAQQSRGDWSDAPVRDLVLTFTLASVSGDMQFGGPRRHRRFHPGQFVLVPPQCRTTFIIDGPHSLRFAALPYASLLDLSGADSGLPPDGDFGVLHDGVSEDGAVRRLFHALWQHGAQGGTGGALQADGLTLQLLGRLLDLGRGPDRRRKPAAAALTGRQLKRLTEYLDANHATEVHLSELAALVGLSPEHLCRAFKAETGLPPYAWLMQRRIERAKALMLAHPRLGLTEIAQTVGYAGQGPFGAAFRRVTGATPSAWRKLNAA